MRISCKAFSYGPVCSSMLRSKAKTKLLYISQCSNAIAMSPSALSIFLSNVHPNITKQEGSLGLNLSNNTHRCSNCLLR